MLSPSDFHQARILIVDDQEANVVLLQEMLTGAGYLGLSTSRNPAEVAERHRSEAFDLILLDLQMPRMDGFQVMDQLRADQPEGCLPVLVITAQPGHKLRALAAGALDFVSKPFDLTEVLARVRNLLEARLLHKQLQQTNEQLEMRVQERTRDLQESYLDTIFTLTRAAEHKDEDTGHHVQRISAYSRELASLLGMDEAFVKLIFIASPMHDIGKIGIPDRVLLKPSGFTPAEKRIMESHSAMGARILGRNDSPYLKMGAEIALNHHEAWDGSGYPRGLAGEAIPLTARIMNICDIYDALRSKRPYKPAQSHGTAIAIIEQGDGRTLPGHFDPAIRHTFLQHAATFEDIFEAHSN